MKRMGSGRRRIKGREKRDDRRSLRRPGMLFMGIVCFQRSMYVPALAKWCIGSCISAVYQRD